MAPDPNVRERAEQRLRRMLSIGDLLPGMTVQIATLARQWAISETPIREVGWRAVGEGWLVPEPRGGFRVWEPNIEELRDLYDALELVLVTAVGLIVDPVDVRSAIPIATIENPLLEITRSAGNLHLLEFAQRIFDRLSPFKRAESVLLIDVSGESDRLHQTATEGTRAEIRTVIRRYCARRRTIAPAMIGLVSEWRRAGAEH